MAAEAIGVSEIQVSDWIRRGYLKADVVRYSGIRQAYEIPRTELRAFIVRRKKICKAIKEFQTCGNPQ